MPLVPGWIEIFDTNDPLVPYSTCLPPPPPACCCSFEHVLQGKGVLDTSMPALPQSVHAVPHVNECFDWGTFGWVGAGCRGSSGGMGSVRGRAGVGLHASPIRQGSSWPRPLLLPCPLCCIPLHSLAPGRPLRPSWWTPRAIDTSSSSTPA